MQLFSPMEYLKIDVAGSFGLDKKNWDERIAWFDEHEALFEPLLTLAESGKPTKGTLLAQADAPALFYAGLKAWQKASRGEAIGYAISLDATASGAQFLSILIGCEKSAAFCNVFDTGNREDFYTALYGALYTRMENPGDISRTLVKDAMVPWFYGSEAKPEEVFGEGEQLRVFKETMQEDAPGLNDLREALIGLWNPDALVHEWVLPDNFHVKVKVMDDHVETVHFLNRPEEVFSKVNRTKDSGVSNAANVIHSIDGMVVREVLRRCNYNAARMEKLLELLTSDRPLYEPTRIRTQDTTVKNLWDHYRRTGFLSARIFELLDEENLWLLDDLEPIKALISTLPDRPFPVLTNHDCFRVHPNNGNMLRKTYNQILFELSQSTILADLATQISGEPTEVTKYGHLGTEILEANYALS